MGCPRRHMRCAVFSLQHNTVLQGQAATLRRIRAGLTCPRPRLDSLHPTSSTIARLSLRRLGAGSSRCTLGHTRLPPISPPASTNSAVRILHLGAGMPRQSAKMERTVPPLEQLHQQRPTGVSRVLAAREATLASSSLSSSNGITSATVGVHCNCVLPGTPPQECVSRP